MGVPSALMGIFRNRSSEQSLNEARAPVDAAAEQLNTLLPDGVDKVLVIRELIKVRAMVDACLEMDRLTKVEY